MRQRMRLDSSESHKDDNGILEPSALCVRSALVNKLYCAVCAVFVCVVSWVSCLLSTPPCPLLPALGFLTPLALLISVQ